MSAPRLPHITVTPQPYDRQRAPWRRLAGARPRPAGPRCAPGSAAGQRFPVAVDRATGLLRLNSDAA
jgi:hypothetical protein